MAVEKPKGDAMKKTISRKQRAEEVIEYIKSIRDEEGYAVVDIDVSGGDGLYDPLGMGKGRDLRSDIYDYIASQTNVVPADVPLRIRFHGNISETEQKEIPQIMHRHYTMKSLDVAWDMAANLRKMLLLILFGVAVLALYFYFAFTRDDAFFAEILSIVGSFSLWEAADAFLLERPHLRREAQNIEQNLSQKIEFVPIEE